MAITAGQKLTASRLNIRTVRARRTTTLSLTSGTLTAVTLDTSDFDNSSMFTPGGSLITLPIAGVWGFQVYGSFASNATGQRRFLMEIGTTGVYTGIDSRPAVSGDVTHITLSGSYVASAGDQLRVVAHQTSGGALNLLAGLYITAWYVAS
ncbi:hypothetical protein ACQP2H_10565 [Micromonospora sp. CA-248260]|uniref:hypothetical protein n=1 Tax=Micromonospora sp. CA-248260 TaxID=3239962 RepID=UPI003D8A532B